MLQIDHSPSQLQTSFLVKEGMLDTQHRTRLIRLLSLLSPSSL